MKRKRIVSLGIFIIVISMLFSSCIFSKPIKTEIFEDKAVITSIKFHITQEMDITLLPIGGSIYPMSNQTITKHHDITIEYKHPTTSKVMKYKINSEKIYNAAVMYMSKNDTTFIEEVFQGTEKINIPINCKFSIDEYKDGDRYLNLLSVKTANANGVVEYLKAISCYRK